MRNNTQDMAEVVAARSRFAAMAVTYFLGVFNDNFYKQAALLLAVAGGMSGLQGKATILFSLPFVLFSAYGGWLADHFSKRHVVLTANFLEVIAMIIGAYGVLTMNWSLILAMVGLMGLQSTFFGPALNGSIPEIYPSWYVTRANAFLKLFTTAAILLGMAAAGIALDQNWLKTEIPFGRILVASIMLAVALAGLIVSFGMKKIKSAGSHAPFPWTGPLASLRDVIQLRSDPPLVLAVIGDCYFYFLSLLAVMVINTMGISQLNMSKSATSLLAVSLMVGVCIGSFVAARITSAERWTHVLAPASFGMGGFLFAAGLIAQTELDMQWVLLFLALIGAGFFGGVFLIPLTAFIQVRPGDDEKGKVIAAANFCAFSGMLLAGQVFTIFDNYFLPSSNMLFLGGLGMVAAILFYSAAIVASRYA
jgi:MFS family permease